MCLNDSMYLNPDTINIDQKKEKMIQYIYSLLIGKNIIHN
jgi:hypothetical protein